MSAAGGKVDAAVVFVMGLSFLFECRSGGQPQISNDTMGRFPLAVDTRSEAARQPILGKMD